jgi:hypothetical protein
MQITLSMKRSVNTGQRFRTSGMLPRLGHFHHLDGSQQEWRVCFALVLSHRFGMVQEIRQGFAEKDGARCEASVGFFD